MCKDGVHCSYWDPCGEAHADQGSHQGDDSEEQEVERRVGASKTSKDKVSLEKVKGDLSSAMTLLDKAATNEKDGTEEQWLKVERLFDIVGRASDKSIL